MMSEQTSRTAEDVVNPNTWNDEWDAVVQEVAQEQETGVPATPAAIPVEGQAPAAEPASELQQVLQRLAELEGTTRGLDVTVRRAEGRVSAMQSAMDKARAQAQTAGVAAPTGAQIGAAAADPAEWAQLKTEFPEWANATEKFISARLQGLPAPQVQAPGPAPQEIADLAAQTAAKILADAETARVARRVPDWQQVVKTDDFRSWFAAQPPAVRSLGASPYAEDAIEIVQAYKSQSGAAQAATLNARRSARVATATVQRASVNAAPAKSVDAMSPEEYWDYEVKRRAQARQN